MAAPKGNKFWMARSTHGRRLKYQSAEVLWDACCEYFQWVEDNPLWEADLVKYQGEAKITKIPKMRAMTKSAMCRYIGLDMTNWDLYKERGDDFRRVIDDAENVIYTQKFEGAAADLLNPNIIARDLGLAEKKETNINELREIRLVLPSGQLTKMLQSGAVIEHDGVAVRDDNPND